MKNIQLKKINKELLKQMKQINLYPTHHSFLTEEDTCYNFFDYQIIENAKEITTGQTQEELLEEVLEETFEVIACEFDKIKISEQFTLEELAKPKSIIFNENNQYMGFEIETPHLLPFYHELIDEDFSVSLSDATTFYTKLNDTVEKAHQQHICFPTLFLDGGKNILYNKDNNELLLFDFPNFQIEDIPPILTTDALPEMENTIYSTTKYFDDGLYTENYDRLLILWHFLEFCTNQPLFLYDSFRDGDMMDIICYLSMIGLDTCEALYDIAYQSLDLNSFDDISNLTPIFQEIEKEYALIKKPNEISTNPYQYEFVKKKELKKYVS